MFVSFVYVCVRINKKRQGIVGYQELSSGYLGGREPNSWNLVGTVALYFLFYVCMCSISDWEQLSREYTQ